MITEQGISLQVPKVSITWGTPRNALLAELTPLGLRDGAPHTNVVWFQRSVLVPGLSGSFSMYGFSEKDSGVYAVRVGPTYDSRKPDLKENFLVLNSLLISMLGEPTESYPEYGINNERFDGFKWVVGTLEVYHDITERHGPMHLVRIIKKR